jgi:hypothetical protein
MRSSIRYYGRVIRRALFLCHFFVASMSVIIVTAARLIDLSALRHRSHPILSSAYDTKGGDNVPSNNVSTAS